MRLDESFRATLSILGAMFGFVTGSLVAIWGVTLFYRSQPLGGGSFAPLGECIRDLLLGGMLGGAVGCVLSWNLCSVLCRWLNRPPYE
jgi:hypothetical protein